MKPVQIIGIKSAQEEKKGKNNMKNEEKNTPKKVKTTSKKVKVIGYQQYLNTSTGEVEEFQVVNIEDRDFDFHKLWLAHIINSLDLIGNQKTRLAFWIIDHLNRENQLIMTYRQIAEKSGISLDTVRVTMKSLLNSDFLVRINQGAYGVNPNVIFKGGRQNRLNVLYQYNVTKQEQEKKQKQKQKQDQSDVFDYIDIDDQSKIDYQYPEKDCLIELIK